VWNHSFYWNCLSPKGGGEPSGALADAIVKNFTSFAVVQREADRRRRHAIRLWLGLAGQEPDGSLAIEQTSNAATPLKDGKKPLLTVDVWEHAYYIDYRNARPPTWKPSGSW
jgi:Fe-Mn family superoxide dismutase